MSDKMVFAYWNIRGRGQFLRHLLAYSGLEWQEKSYTGFDEYLQEKFKLGLDFPNLPYLLDGQIRITESIAIGRYVIRKSNKLELLGKNAKDEAIMDNLIYVVWDDIVMPLIRMFLSKKIMDIKTAHYYKNMNKYEKLEKFLKGKPFSLGYLTLLDFYIAEGSYYIEKLFPEEYEAKYKSIQRIRENIEALPQIKAYYERDKCILTPFLRPNMTAIPFYYPGTEPKNIPTFLTKKPTQKAPLFKQKPKEQYKRQENKQQIQKAQQSNQPQAQQQKPEEIKVEKKEQEEQAVGEQQFYVPERVFNVVVISGSLGANSAINYLLQALMGIEHPAYNFQWVDVSNLELHHQDIDEEGTENVNNLRAQVYQADGVLIGLSETHGGLSSVLVNVYNWLVPVLQDKPVALLAIETSQAALRYMLETQNIHYMPNPEFTVSGQNYFDNEGNIAESNFPFTKHFFNNFVRFMQSHKS